MFEIHLSNNFLAFCSCIKHSIEKADSSRTCFIIFSFLVKFNWTRTRFMYRKVKFCFYFVSFICKPTKHTVAVYIRNTKAHTNNKFQTPCLNDSRFDRTGSNLVFTAFTKCLAAYQPCLLYIHDVIRIRNTILK